MMKAIFINCNILRGYGHFGTKDGQIVTKSGQIGRKSDLARLLPYLG